jgi:transcriptional regulator with GAF, ATPase, and Fis domain
MSKRSRGRERPDLARIEAALDAVREACRKLVEENRWLRDDPARPSGLEAERLQLLETRVAHLEAENEQLRQELNSAPARDRQEERDDLLASLYVASFQLHRTLDLDSVLASVREILINLVGVERFVIYLLDGERRSLLPVADDSCQRPSGRQLPLGEGIVGVVAKTGIPYFDAENVHGDFHNPLACVPMRIDGQVIGVIQVSRLFVQKTSLTAQDHELFSLLAETAGAALLAATMRQQLARDFADEAQGWATVLSPVLQATDDRCLVPEGGDAEAGRVDDSEAAPRKGAN